jgi:hypothetical protein
VELDVSQNYNALLFESADIFNECIQYEKDMSILQQSKETFVSVESIDSDIGVRVGLGGGKKDRVTGKAPLLDVHVTPKIKLMDAFIRKVKEIAVRVWTAIKNFFISIFHFFQSKIHAADKLLTNTNFSVIQAYFNSSSLSVKTDLTKYALREPIADFKQDTDILRSSIPSLRDAILQVINNVEYPTDKYNSKAYVKQYNKDVSETAKIIESIYGQILPKNINPDLMSEMNIASVLRKKYFGDKKEKAVMEIKDFIKDPSIYEWIISDDAFNSFKSMYKQCQESIADATKAVDRFKKTLDNIQESSDFYTDLQYQMMNYRALLTTMLYTVIAYWELYFTIRTDTMNSARAIVKAAVS